MSHYTIKNSKGFTLAEVLITLGIIGVVAAMTLPSLVTKYKDKELITRTKKVYSDINNALLLAQKDYGVSYDNSFLFNTTDDTATVAEKFAKYFKGAKFCKNSSQKGCSKYYYDIKYSKLALDKNNMTTSYKAENAPQIILADGAIIQLKNNQYDNCIGPATATETDDYLRPVKDENGQTITHEYTLTNCGAITFDVNGVKNPNQFGRDVYHTAVRIRNIVPQPDYHKGYQSFENILTGKDELEYVNYSKGKPIDNE